MNFADCIETLCEHFDPSGKCKLYLVGLLGCKKRRGEDWATFAEDLKTLVDKAYPKLQDGAKEANKDAPPIRETGSPWCNWPDTGGCNRGQISGTNNPQCNELNTAEHHHQG